MCKKFKSLASFVRFVVVAQGFASEKDFPGVPEPVSMKGLQTVDPKSAPAGRHYSRHTGLGPERTRNNPARSRKDRLL